MIPKMSSHDFNNMLNDIKLKASDIANDIEKIKKNINKKVLVLKHEVEYSNFINTELETKIRNGIPSNDNGQYILLNNNYQGLYETYSNLIHPYFKKEPINIFNLKSIDQKEIYFRDEVNVAINDVFLDYYKNILMSDDHPKKEIFFEEYEYNSKLEIRETHSVLDEKNDIKITIAIDKDKILGISKFNLIEIDPYLLKSFDINSIEIYEDDGKIAYKTNAIKNVGKTRLVLDKKYEFRKVVFHITPHYETLNSAGKRIIPFGLKHIYFYDADFRNDSYIVIKYDSNKYIDNIKNDLEVLTPFGLIDSTIKEEGIKIYLECNDGKLENEQQPTMNIKKPIVRNIKTIYFYVPLQIIPKNGYLIGYKFNIEFR